MMRITIVISLLLAIAGSRSISKSGRIIGGQEAKEGQFPYQVSLRFRGSHVCGGVIINNSWIMTAAHCVKGKIAEDLSIAVGTIHVNGTGGDIYQLLKTIIHPQYDSLIFHGDIALCKTTKPINFTKHIKPIRISKRNITENSDVTLSGWGRTVYPDGGLSETLQWINLKTISRRECIKMNFWPPIWDNELCTLTKEGEGACHGDSGGPLVLEGEVCGIVSWGTPCALGKPDVFTKPYSFYEWIIETMKCK